MGVKVKDDGLLLTGNVIDRNGKVYKIITASLAVPIPILGGGRWLRYESVAIRYNKKGRRVESLVERYEFRSEAERQHVRIIEAIKKGAILERA